MKEKIRILERDDSKVKKLREEWLKKGYELINITTLCELKKGNSGWCNGINEPDETIHHVQIWYRDENIAVIGANGGYVIDNKKYLWFKSGEKDESDFIVFRKVKI